MLKHIAWIGIGLMLIGLGCQTEEQVRYDQYIATGYELYKNNCANCHQVNGKGLGNLYPAISKDFLKDKSEVICWIKNGVNIPMAVNGQVFHRAMPANPALKDLEIAELMTFLYHTWGNEKNIISVDSVRVALDKCDLAQ